MGTEWPCPWDILQSEGCVNDASGPQEQLRGRGSGNRIGMGAGRWQRAEPSDCCCSGVSKDSGVLTTEHSLGHRRCYRAEPEMVMRSTNREGTARPSITTSPTPERGYPLAQVQDYVLPLQPAVHRVQTVP